MAAAVNCLVNDASLKFVLASIRRRSAQIRYPVSAAENGLSFANDKNRCARSVAGFQRSKDGIDLVGGNLG